MSHWLKRVILALVGLVVLTVTVLAMLATLTKLPGEEKTAAGPPGHGFVRNDARRRTDCP